MAHVRVRPYNIKDTAPGGSVDFDLCMAVRSGDRIWLRGQTGIDLDGNFVGTGDAAAQAEVSLRQTCVVLTMRPSVIHECSCSLVAGPYWLPSAASTV